MNFAAFPGGGWTSPLLNHLWQSTVVVGVAWLLAFALRKNHARARYWVWMAASLKFLFPFSLLIAAGEWLRSLASAPGSVHPVVANVMNQVTEPFAGTRIFDAAPTMIVAHHGNGLLLSTDWRLILLLAVWVCGVLVVAIRFGRGWLRVYAAKRAALPLALEADVPVLSSPTLIEPGIFGFFRPVLLMPEGILERLAPEQLEAIVAHEMCHVRRRDNLTFALHMIVEVLFWFYPPVWWFGARLIEERERACDEAVVEARDKAWAYAEGILNVCKFCVESPVACVAGVTGADLKKRIARIMTGQSAKKLSLGRKLMIAAAGTMAVVAPLTLGIMHAAQSKAQQTPDGAATNLPKYEVASIKPHPEEGMMMRAGMRMTPDGVSVDGMPLQILVRQAFGLSADRILNVPEWVKSARFDIEAKVAPDDVQKLASLSTQQRGEMMLPLLEERFGLRFHHETRVLPVQTLEAAKGGPKLKEAKPDEAGGTEANQQADSATSAHQPRMGMSVSPQGMSFGGTDVSLPMLAQLISQQTGSTVVDKTALSGRYDISLTFAPDMNGPTVMRVPGGTPQDGAPATPEMSGPTLQEALQEQLGLKLVMGKQPVDVVVIDQFQQPSAN